MISDRVQRNGRRGVIVSLTSDPAVIFQLQLLTTWGDPYYTGLNGLEFYDQNQQKISLTDNSIQRLPLTSTSC